jgi:phospholipid/cholesterol/gamma-HCH transport system ATP-binding protein
MTTATAVAPQPAVIAAAIEVRTENACKSFDEQIVLAEISLEILSGEIVAIVGGSGSGKSVLMHLLIGLMKSDSGRVFVADHSRPKAPLVQLSKLGSDQTEDVRLHWAVIFQRNALFSGTVRENIALLLREHAISNGREISEEEINKQVQLSLTAVALDPEETKDKDCDTLSGGMGKRVAIARSLAIDPTVIFYDEPTTGLDPVVGAQMHDLIFETHHRKTASGQVRTSILVTHDKDLLRRVRPRIIMLHGTKVVFSGTYEQFEAETTGPPFEYLRTMPVLNANPERRKPARWYRR